MEQSPLVPLALLVPAGAVEGSLLGWGQARVLRRMLAVFAAGRLFVATSVAAAFAYGGRDGSRGVGEHLLWLPVLLL